MVRLCSSIDSSSEESNSIKISSLSLSEEDEETLSSGFERSLINGFCFLGYLGSLISLTIGMVDIW